MSEPIYDDMAEDVYENLPEHFRRVDPVANYHMKKLIASMTPLIDTIDKTIQSFDYIPPEDGGDPDDPSNTSALVDPTKADPRYFPWLAQIYGVRLNSKLGYEAQRQQLVNASVGYRSGTPEAIEAAAKTYLTGDRYARVYGHSTAAGRGTGGPWDLLLVTKSSETLRNLFPESTAIASNIGALSNAGFVYRFNKCANPSFEANTTGWIASGAAVLARTANADIAPPTRPNPVQNSSWSLKVTPVVATAQSGALTGFTSTASDPVVQRTNLYTDPSMTTTTGKAVYGAGALATSTAWFDSGTTSMRITPSAGNNISAMNVWTAETTLNGLTVGHTYTVSATVRLSAAQTGSLHDHARKIAVHLGNSAPTPLFITSDQAPNAPGVYRLSTTFTVPVGTTRAQIKLYNGSPNVAEPIWWDSLLIEETSELRPYFDGATPYADPVGYIWTGTANASTSQVVIGNVVTVSAHVYVHSSEALASNISIILQDNSSNTVYSAPASQVGWQRLQVTTALPATSGVCAAGVVTRNTNTATGVYFGVDGVLIEEFTRFVYSYFDGLSTPKITPYKTSYTGGTNTSAVETAKMSAKLVSDPDVFSGRAYNLSMATSPYEIDLALLTARPATVGGSPSVMGDAMSFAFGTPTVKDTVESPHQIMFKARTAGYELPLNIAVTYRDVAGVLISQNEVIEAGIIDGTWKQFNLWTLTPPDDTTQISFTFYYDFENDISPTVDQSQVQLFLAELGLRIDPETAWTPISADPAQLVAQLGAKPAGYKIHYATLVTTWDTIESVYPTWSLLDGNTWRTIEESGVEVP